MVLEEINREEARLFSRGILVMVAQAIWGLNRGWLVK